VIPDRDTVIERIAKEELGFQSLETRKSDTHDFRDCAVWCVLTALQRAYEAGLAAGRKETQK